MDAWQCVHKIRGRPKICDSPLCSEHALACTSCQQCMDIHEHQGTLTLRNIPVIGVADTNNANANWQQVSRAASKTVEILKEVFGSIDADTQLLNSMRGLQPTARRLTQMIKQFDNRLVGADAAQLLALIKKGDIFSKDDKIDVSLNDLQQAYSEFISSVEQLIDRFENDKLQFLQPKSAIRRQERQKELANETQLQPKKALKYRVKSPERAPPRYVPMFAKPIQQFISRPQSEEINWEELDISSMSSSSEDESKYKTHESHINIGDIGPKEYNLNIIGKVLKTYSVNSHQGRFVRCLLGDETGTVWCSFPESKLIHVGSTLEFMNLKSIVVRKYGSICLNMGNQSSIKESSRTIGKINKNVNISKDRIYGKEWW